MRKIVIAAVAAVVVVFGGAYAFLSLRNNDSPDKVKLSAEQTPATVAGAAIDGRWVVKNPDSFVGYRVQEKLARLPVKSDAVGRTTAVTGEMTVAGTQVTAGSVTADVTQLKSDETRRDSSVKTKGLETDKFPSATFTLDQPVTLTGPPAQGQAVNATAAGTLDLHGTKKQVSVPIQARWSGDTIELVGSLPISFADYGMTPPNFAGFVEVDDNGTLELQLTLVRA